MNLTNFISPNTDKEKILEICKKIFSSGELNGIISLPSKQAESYYCNRANLLLFESEIFDYDFNTPAELRKMLQEMWKYQGCEYMTEFAVVAAISAFHNQNKTPDEGKNEIPAFIYHF